MLPLTYGMIRLYVRTRTGDPGPGTFFLLCLSCDGTVSWVEITTQAIASPNSSRFGKPPSIMTTSRTKGKLEMQCHLSFLTWLANTSF